MLNEGDKAPVFKAKDQSGKVVSLSDFKGKTVILYFYPKDDTPGCTAEACSFRDNFSAFKKAGAVILGVSIDDASSHKKFMGKYELPFTLLADTDKRIVTQYGVWVQKSMYGRKYMGTERTTFLIDGKGKIKKIFYKVSPSEHVKELLDVIKTGK